MREAAESFERQVLLTTIGYRYSRFQTRSATRVHEARTRLSPQSQYGLLLEESWSFAEIGLMVNRKLNQPVPFSPETESTRRHALNIRETPP